MNILIISTVNYGMTGIAVVIRNLYANNVYANDKLTFFVPDRSNAERIAELKEHGYSIMTYTERNKRPLKYIGQLIRLMKNEKYDIVHIHGNSATCTAELIAAKAAGVPVRIMHGHAASCEHAFLHKLLQPLMNRLVTHRFACSKEAGAFLFGKKDCTVILNAFALEKFREDPQLREKYRKEYGITEKTVIGHVGLFNNMKNQAFLVDILACYKKHNPNAVLVLIGEGELRQSVQEKAAQMGLADSVLFLGARDNVNELLNMFDYFVLPSFFEGFGIAPVEAQVNGLPTLASKDRLPANVQINNSFKFVALEDGAEKWCDELIKLPPQRCATAMENAKNAGFDLREEVARLRQRYCDMLKG